VGAGGGGVRVGGWGGGGGRGAGGGGGGRGGARRPRPPATAVLIALAVRPRQAPERLTAPLERAHREGVLTRIALGALNPAEAGAFLGQALDPVEAAALYEESGGNPFYLQQLA